MTLPLFESLATLSADGRYRYSLTRRWDDRPLLAWCMLNPSKADADTDDPTIGRCAGFSRRWGYGGIVVVNLFGLRATDPHALAVEPDPVGPGNRAAVRELTSGLQVVAAWGATVEHLPRWSGYVEETGWWLRRHRVTCALGFTANGHPRHPLYLRGDTVARLWPYDEDRLL